MMFGKLLAAYLIGSVSGSLLLGRLRGVDIRTLGSGNAGGTNALRTQGLKFALGVVLIDVGKGALATWIGLQSEPDTTIALRLALGCGFAAMLGHVWPLFHGFRGGKGVATVIGLLLVLWPLLVLPMLAAFALALTTTGYVGLGSILAGFTMLPAAWWLSERALAIEWWIAGGVVALFLLFTHRVNVQRLFAGNENRFDKARLLARLFGR
ncbi:MAG TPA: glycerol-3-phosphate 1-O-acyltransferase PlsY [Pseudomonadota bacterium]|nr:glycerol-3-phosphate 1-O-acyltransferase PlsY [Pseudomonadota bacterium]